MRRLLVALSAALAFTAACGGDGGVSSTGAGDDTETTESTTPDPATVETTAAPDSGEATTTITAPPTAPASVATTAQATTTTKASTTVKAGPTPTAPAITFATFSVTVNPKCPTTTPNPDVSYTAVTALPSVIVTWKLSGTIPDNVYTAVDDPNGVYENGLGTTGSATFSKDCNAQHTYYVVAELDGQKFVKSKKA